MRTSEAGVSLIKEFEGFPFGGRPYQDMVRVWTIGYGHTEGVGPHSPRLTIEQASDLLLDDLNRKYAPHVAQLGVELEQNQFDALVSFVYNCGPGAIGDTRVGRSLRARQYDAAADALLAWNKAGRQVVPGLVRRRQAERALFLSADHEDQADPLEGYTENEKAWIREYDRLRRKDENLERRKALRAMMRAQRKRIWHVARPQEKGGDGQGWDHAHRRERYRSLLARTS